MGKCEVSIAVPQGIGSREPLLLRHLTLRTHYPAGKSGQALLLTYGRFFAEFLNEESLVPLGLLALSTCVGLRYDSL